MAEKCPHMANMLKTNIYDGSNSPPIARLVATIFPNNDPITSSGTRLPPGTPIPKAKANNSIFATYKKISLKRLELPVSGKNIKGSLDENKSISMNKTIAVIKNGIKYFTYGLILNFLKNPFDPITQ